MSKVPGVVDLQIEPQVEISQLRLRVKREEAARYGLAPGDVAELLETAYKGRVVSEVLDEDRYFDLVVWYDEAVAQRSGRRSTRRSSTRRRAARWRWARWPRCWTRPAPTRSTAKTSSGGSSSPATCRAATWAASWPTFKQALARSRSKLRQLPGNYRIEYGGQFEAQQQANRRLLVLGLLAVVGVFLLLWKCLESWRGGPAGAAGQHSAGRARLGGRCC